MPIAAEITAGEVSDYSGFDPLMEAEGPEAKVLLADRGYDSDAIRATIWRNGARRLHSDKQERRKVQIPVDGAIYALRNRIERCFNAQECAGWQPGMTKPQPAISASSISPQSVYLDPRICQQDLSSKTRLYLFVIFRLDDVQSTIVNAFRPGSITADVVAILMSDDLLVPS